MVAAAAAVRVPVGVAVGVGLRVEEYEEYETKVVLANPMPPVPKLIVCPFITAVVGVAPGPKVYVVPPITARLEPISVNVTPPAVTALVVGLNGYWSVAAPSTRPADPAVILCPLIMVV